MALSISATTRAMASTFRSTSSHSDVEVTQPPTDSISSLAFSSQADHLAVGSWDNSVRIYGVGSDMKSRGKAMHHHEGAVLSVCWNNDGTKVFSGGTDNTGRMFDVVTSQATQVAQHDAPIKAVKWIDAPQTRLLFTGSWDKTIKYWDLRSSTPAGTFQLPERCYTLDVQYPHMVVGMADRHIQVFNLGYPVSLIKTMRSPLSLQTRVVSCFQASTKNGFAVGSVEGRVAIHFMEAQDSSKSYTFRCHRQDRTPNSKDQAVVYPVNDISFHPIQGTFSTCGSDGIINLWDKDSRSRIKTFSPVGGPITCTTFNRDGTLFAYAVSYDWHKGHSGMTPNALNKLMLHKCEPEEVRRRPLRKA